jgi:hypothetical protein
MKGKVLLQGLVLLICLMMLSAPNVLAGPLAGIPCNGDFNNDGNVDATDVSEFLVHFGRSIFNDPCPPPDPSGGGVPKTGQRSTYGPWDDGALTQGIEWPNPRFTDHGDSTVTDNLTGLIWTKDATIGSTYPWNDALDLVSSYNSLSYAGYNDWRMPNAREIQTLLDYGQQSPALPIGHPFEQVGGPTDAAFWTSTTSPYNTADAFVCTVNKDHQLLARSKTGYAYRLWMVRGPSGPDCYCDGDLCGPYECCCEDYYTGSIECKDKGFCEGVHGWFIINCD